MTTHETDIGSDGRAPEEDGTARPAEDAARAATFGGSDHEWLELVKTVVAMANSGGGSIDLESFDCAPDLVQTRSLDDRINRYIEPKFHDVTSIVNEDGSCTISVARSGHSPHVFVIEGEGAFHAGQVFIRRDGEAQPVTGDELQRMVLDSASYLLMGVSAAIERLAVEVREPGLVPLGLASSGAISFSIRTPDEAFPYLTADIATKIDKGTQWTARALAKLGLRQNPKFRWELRTARGNLIAVKYTEEAYSLLRQKLEEDPDFNPWHD